MTTTLTLKFLYFDFHILYFYLPTGYSYKNVS